MGRYCSKHAHSYIAHCAYCLRDFLLEAGKQQVRHNVAYTARLEWKYRKHEKKPLDLVLP